MSMTYDFFEGESKRLSKEFQFSTEKISLIWQEVKDLDENNYRKIVDLCIGEFNSYKPPKISEIREFAHQQRKENFNRQERQAIKAVNTVLENINTGNLPLILKSMGINKLADAVDKAISAPLPDKQDEGA